MSEPKRVKHGGAAYHDYVGDSPRIAMVLTPLDETNLALAAQIGVTGWSGDRMLTGQLVLYNDNNLC